MRSDSTGWAAVTAALVGYAFLCVTGVHLLKRAMSPTEGEALAFGMGARQCVQFALGFIAAGLGFVLWLLVLKRLPASVAFPVAVGASAIGVVAVDAWLGEPVGLRRLLGVVLIIVGVSLASRASASIAG
jgi:multidrug transporter EmrE-like cation transporter